MTRAVLVCGAWFVSFLGCFLLSRSIAPKRNFLWVWWDFAFMPIPPKSWIDARFTLETIANVFINPGSMLTPFDFIATAALASLLAIIGAVSLGRRWPGGLLVIASPLVVQLAVSALRVDHPPVTECYALRFAHGGRRIVFSADTAYFPPLADFARGADILVHEAMLEAGVDRLVERTGNGERLKAHLMASHTLAADAGRIATDAGVGHLVLHHLIPADDPEFGEEHWREALRTVWNGPLIVGYDGLTLAIEQRAKAEPEGTRA